MMRGVMLSACPARVLDVCVAYSVEGDASAVIPRPALPDLLCRFSALGHEVIGVLYIAPRNVEQYFVVSHVNALRLAANADGSATPLYPLVQSLLVTTQDGADLADR